MCCLRHPEAAQQERSLGFVQRPGVLPEPVHETILGEFTGLVRFSAEGSRQFFESLDRHVWQHGIQGYVADVLCALHRKWELAFHLSTERLRLRPWAASRGTPEPLS